MSPAGLFHRCNQKTRRSQIKEYKMNIRGLTVLLLALAVIAAVIVIKLISGVAALISGALNFLLGLAIIVVLVIIVAWMFRYAKKNK